MDFHLSKEQEMVRKMYREFAENEVKPLAEEIDEEERFPMETVEKMAKLGMMGRRYRLRSHLSVLRPHFRARHRGAEDEVPA